MNSADGVPLICAGKENGRISRHCRKYDKSSNTWKVSGRQATYHYQLTCYIKSNILNSLLNIMKFLHFKYK